MLKHVSAESVSIAAKKNEHIERMLPPVEGEAHK